MTGALALPHLDQAVPAGAPLAELPVAALLLAASFRRFARAWGQHWSASGSAVRPMRVQGQLLTVAERRVQIE